MSAHAKGSWRLDPYNCNVILSSVNGDEVGTATNETNARLMASAPMMLDMLRMVYAGQIAEIGSLAVADVIAKATGERS